MKVMRFLVVGVTLALAACNKPAATDKAADVAAVPATPALVTVNGKPISNQLYEDYVKALTQGKASKDLSPEDREQIKENLVRMELIAQQAEKDGLTRDPEVAARLELSRINLLQQASAQKYLKDRTPTEAELRAEFETQLATTPLVEYHARHILVSGEDVAIKIIEQLKSGADFALARQASLQRQAVGRQGRRSRVVLDERHGETLCRRGGLAQERRVHQDASAYPIRLARDPAHRHARSCTARLRSRAGSGQADPAARGNSAPIRMSW